MQKIVRFQIWIYLFVIIGEYAGASNFLARIERSGWPHEITVPLVRQAFTFLFSTAFSLVVLSARLSLTSQGYSGFIGITWRGKTVKMLHQFPLRNWRGSLVHLEFGWPFYPMVIGESRNQFPVVFRFFTTDYRGVCEYILKYGLEAKIDDRTLAHLKKISGG